MKRANFENNRTKSQSQTFIEKLKSQQVFKKTVKNITIYSPYVLNSIIVICNNEKDINFVS